MHAYSTSPTEICSEEHESPDIYPAFDTGHGHDWLHVALTQDGLHEHSVDSDTNGWLQHFGAVQQYDGCTDKLIGAHIQLC